MDKKIANILGLGAADIIAASTMLRYTTSGTQTFHWWNLQKEKPRCGYVLLRGSHYLAIYNQIYHHQLFMGIGPVFYHSTIRGTIL